MNLRDGVFWVGYALETIEKFVLEAGGKMIGAMAPAIRAALTELQ